MRPLHQHGGSYCKSRVKLNIYKVLCIALLQVYIVTGGFRGASTTETLLKDGGTAWQYAAELPSARHGVRGLGLDNGRFMVVGE